MLLRCIAAVAVKADGVREREPSAPPKVHADVHLDLPNGTAIDCKPPAPVVWVARVRRAHDHVLGTKAAMVEDDDGDQALWFEANVLSIAVREGELHQVDKQLPTLSPGASCALVQPIANAQRQHSAAGRRSYSGLLGIEDTRVNACATHWARQHARKAMGINKPHAASAKVVPIWTLRRPGFGTDVIHANRTRRAVVLR